MTEEERKQYDAGYVDGSRDSVEEIAGIVFSTFQNDTMKILNIQRWIKENRERWKSSKEM